MNMMESTFELFGLTGHLYGVCAAAALLILTAGVRFFGRGLPKGTAGLYGVLAAVLGVAGARLLYCVCNLTTFTETFENPWLILCFFDGGLSMPGAILGLTAAALIAAKVQKTSAAQLMDAVCLSLGLALAVLRFGEQFTDIGMGKAVTEGFATANLPWLFQYSRMGVAVEYRLNVWAYEAFAGLLIFAVTLAVSPRLRRRAGDTALFFFSLFGASQILLESMRDDGHMLLIFLRVGQLAAALMPLIACGFLTRRSMPARRKWTAWTLLALCAGAIVVLEFSLDGRLTFGTPTLLRDYSIMAAVCLVMFAVPCSLLFCKEKKA